MWSLFLKVRYVFHRLQTIESKDYIQAFQIEVKKLIKLSDKEKIWLFIRKYGMRSMSDEKFKWFINYLDKNI